MSHDDFPYPVESIAIIGMAGRFPGSSNLNEFWQNLRDGAEGISRFTEDELLAYGVEPEQMKSSNYVPARGVVQNIELFDAAFFNLSPREAEIMDPQFRFFLENSWESLEDAGYNPHTYSGPIGIFAGMSMGKYLLRHLLPNREVVAAAGPLQLRILNDKDFLTTLVAYKLNLRGPAVNVQTACSTSLVAVHLACQSLVSFQCDLALAGGVSITTPQKSGYWSQEGVFSPDGHCRAFDKDAEGTVSGNGVGTVVLKRLQDAIDDGDHIRAIIRGSAINNDGSLKVSYTAPSIDGQAEVIAMAQAVAQVEPETITYIEAHGTGTPMGDPIEVAALTQVFRAGSDKRAFCGLGSVKTNIGHLDAAAGVASLIKTVLALENKALPPSLHFHEPNPQIDFLNSPFYVNATLQDWKPETTPLRAGVSAFAVGGSNAHLVVEEAPEREPSSPSKPWQLIQLSAKTPAALESTTDNLAASLKTNADVSLADLAYTLKVGRASFDHRRAVVCRDVEELIPALETRDPKRVFTAQCDSVNPSVAFMFPGLGNHYVNMGRELYQLEPGFRTDVDHCCELLKEHLDCDLRDVIYPQWKEGTAPPATPRSVSHLDLRSMLRGHQDDEPTRKLNQTVFSQPALFVIEYALAQLWMRWGIKPQALIGYSIGEYVAACLAGVWSLEDALRLVAKRAQLISQLPAGSMLAISLPSSEVEPLLGKHLSIAAVNGPSVCVASGPPEAIGDLETALAQRGVVVRRLQTGHAFHSRMMEPAVESFAKLMASVTLNAPNIPLISDLTGTWLNASEAMDAQYWATHLCRPVLFGDGIEELWRGMRRLLLEVGPGQALGAWALQHPSQQSAEGGLVLASMRHSYDHQSDQAFLLTTLGRLWLAGGLIDWDSFYREERRLRVPLPAYPFERKRYWVEPPQQNVKELGQSSVNLSKTPDVADWFYVPVWKQALPLRRLVAPPDQKRQFLVFEDEFGIGAGLSKSLRQMGHTVVRAGLGEHFVKFNDETFLLNPKHDDDYKKLLGQLDTLGKLPDVICHLWTLTACDTSDLDFSDQQLDRGFFSLNFVAQAWGNLNVTQPLRLMVVANALHSVSGEEQLCPAKAALIGPCRVIPLEYPQSKCQIVDIVVPSEPRRQEVLTQQLLSELAIETPESLVAYRGDHRWHRSYEKLHVAKDGEPALRDGGVYMITGGRGGIGLTLAQHIARQVRVRLVLVGRSAFPPATEWANWLSSHDEDDEVRQQIEKIQALQTAGAEVFIARGDVTSRDDMKRIINETHEKFGKINGVIHAAGVPPGGMIQLKTPSAAMSVLGPKIKGTFVLDELLRDEQLDFMVLCSSLTAIMGAFGLVDHCAANAFLDVFAEAQASRGNPYILTLNWDAWLEVGQAAKASLSKRLQEILHSGPPADNTTTHWNRLLVDEPDREIHSIELSTTKQWFLNEHRLQGDGVLPGTAYLELVRAAVARRAGDKPITMRKVSFLTPLVIKDDEVREARLILQRRDDAYDFRIVSSRSGKSEWQEHVRGKVNWNEQQNVPQHPLDELLHRLAPQPFKRDERLTEATLSKDFGPRWKNLIRAVGIVDGEGIASLELPPEFVHDLNLFGLHPSLLDAATGFGQLAGKGVYLPQAYDFIRINRPLPQKLFSYVKFKDNGSNNKDALVYDLILMDHEGRELVEIQDYTLRQITDLRAFSGATAKGVFDLNELGETHALAVDLHETGILPAEGAEAFGLVLQNSIRVPRIAISTRNLPALIERAASFAATPILDEVNQLQSQRKKHSRPNLQVSYVSPRNDSEILLTQMWQETLNIEEIGIHDNFFDMGGDSLIATLLVDRLTETFQVNVSLASLINAPTVAEMSDVIAELQPQSIGTTASAGD